MREVFGDFWAYTSRIKVITTNPILRRDGACVMGRGIAKQFSMKYPEGPYILGEKIRKHGNHVIYIGKDMETLVAYFSFPVKYHWRDKADLDLIRQSAEELEYEMNEGGERGPILLVRPGCGNGQLDWRVVRPTIEPFFDDRFVVIERKP